METETVEAVSSEIKDSTNENVSELNATSTAKEDSEMVSAPQKDEKQKLSKDEVKENKEAIEEKPDKDADDKDKDKDKDIGVPSDAEKDNAAAEMEKDETTLQPSLTVSEAENEILPTSASERSDTLKADDNKALKENISHKTMELIEAMDSENATSKSTSPSKAQAKEDKDNTTSLDLLTQYNSDSEQDLTVHDADCEDNDVMEVPVEGSKTYRNKVIEIKSESESESTSSDDSEIEYIAKIRKEIEKTIDLEDDEDDDDDGDDAKKKKKKHNSHMRVKGEMLLEDLPPIQDLHITVQEEECVELGRVHSIVDQLLLVSVLPDSVLLDLDTVLFLDKGKKVLGEVFDVLGQVANPMYCVRFNSNKEIEEKGIKVGDTVYVAPKTQYTQLVVLSSLMKIRGSDASWENDVEPPPHHIDYSDDEQERDARVKLRNQDRPNDHKDPQKRARGNDNKDTDESPSSSQTRNFQRKERSDRDKSGTRRSNYQSPRYRQSPNLSQSGSWHSMYRQPYNPYPNAPFMLQPQSNVMVSTYRMGYAPVPFGSPQMRPIPPPPPPMQMYALNPLAVNCPRMLNTNQQYNDKKPNNRTTTHSPPPPPPGLD